ncbi:MAG: CARDB domain-containing protein [Longimicrobiales bacterium]
MSLTIMNRRVVLATILSALTYAPARAQNPVTSVTPASLTLQVGDATQIVTLHGQKLDQLNGVSVKRNGAKLTAFQTELLPTSNPAQRQLRLVALPGSGPPWGVPLELVVVRNAIEYAVPLQLVAVVPMADLTFDGCSASQSLTALVLRATIRNDGLAPASFQAGQHVGSVTFGTPGSAYPLMEKLFAPGGGFYVGPGSRATLEKQLTGVPAAATYNADWRVNPLNVVAESNTENNARTCLVTVTSVLSDLTISSMTVQPSSGPAGTSFSLQVRVTNLGNARVPPTRTEVRCLIDGIAFNGSTWQLGAIDPGQTLVQQINLGSNLTPGARSLRCSVDPGNDITEAVENNNSNSLTLTVTG